MARPEPSLPPENSALPRAVGGTVAPRDVSWTLFCGLVIAGLAVLVGLVATAGGPPAPEPAAQADEATLSRAVSAYQAQRWDEAEQSFRLLRERHPDHVRVQDYLDRIELTRRDAERLSRAEEALVAGQYERARRLASEVAPNSALFAQADSLSRGTRHEATSVSETGGGQEGSISLDTEVRAALGEARALYADGRFEEAAQRAEGLARQASGGRRQELAAWAHGVRRFGRGYRGLPEADEALLEDIDAVQNLIAFDQRVGEGSYARGLRVRVSEALQQRAFVERDRGGLLEACKLHQLASHFRGHERREPELERRCETEAQRRLTTARALTRQRPEGARALYEQVKAMVTPASGAYRTAEQALRASRR